MYNRIGAQSDGLTKNQSINQSMSNCTSIVRFGIVILLTVYVSFLNFPGTVLGGKSPQKSSCFLFYTIFLALFIFWVHIALNLTPGSQHHAPANARGHCTCQYSLFILLLSV